MGNAPAMSSEGRRRIWGHKINKSSGKHHKEKIKEKDTKKEKSGGHKKKTTTDVNATAEKRRERAL